MNRPAGTWSKGVAESDRIHQLHLFAGFHPTVGMDMEPAAAEVGETHVWRRKGQPHAADKAGMSDRQDPAAWRFRSDSAKGGEGAARHHIGLLGTLRPTMSGQVARPALFDLVHGEALPRPERSLHKARLEPHPSGSEPLGDDRRSMGGTLQCAAPDGVESAQLFGSGDGLTSTHLGEGRVCLSLPAAQSVPLALSVAQGEQAGDRRGAHRSEGTFHVRAAPTSLSRMATLRLFASAREAAGTGKATIDGATVNDVLEAAVITYGAQFQAVLANCKVWVNGNPADPGTPVGTDDEVAVLPPVSGGF